MRLSDIFVESKAQGDEISGSGDEEQGKRLLLKDSMYTKKLSSRCHCLNFFTHNIFFVDPALLSNS